MWTDAARSVSAQVRSGPSGGGGGGGGSVPAQGAAAQNAMVAASRAAGNAYGRQIGGKPKGGMAGQSVGRPAPTGGSASVGPAPPPAAPAHGSGVAAVARNMSAASTPVAATGATTQSDRNAMDNLNARNYSNATMVGDHTTPQALQKYVS